MKPVQRSWKGVSLWLGGWLLVAGPSTWSQDLPAEDVAGVEAIVAVAYPDGVLQWGPELAVSRAGGGLARIQLPGFGALRIASCTRVWAGLEQQGAMAEAVGEILSKGYTTATGVASRIVALELADGGQIIASREATLDPAALMTEIQTVFPKDPTADAWLVFDVTYVGMYSGQDWVASIQWVGLFDAQGASFTERYPHKMWRRRADGTEEAVGVSVERTESIARIRVGTRVVDVACAGGCVVPPSAVLGP